MLQRSIIIMKMSLPQLLFHSTLLLLLLLSVTLCNSLPASQNHGIITSSENPFDGGAVGSCEVPTTSYCTNVDYPVPTSIARLAAILEDSIRKDVELRSNSDSCQQAFKTVLCIVRFPRCEQLQEGSSSLYLNVSLNHNQNCTVLEDVCPSALIPLCNILTQTSLPARGCSSVSELGDFNFSHCAISQTSLVTEWMFEYMKYVDNTIRGILYSGTCGRDLATFLCTTGGKCTDDQQRIEFINTHEQCNAVQNCFSHSDQGFVEASVLSCQLWPQNHLRTVSFSSNPPSPPTETSETRLRLTSMGDANLTTGNSYYYFSSTSEVRQCVAWITAALFLTLIFTS